MLFARFGWPPSEIERLDWKDLPAMCDFYTAGLVELQEAQRQ